MTEPGATVQAPREATPTVDAALHLGLGFTGVAATAGLLISTLGFSWRLPTLALALYAPIAAIALVQVRRHHPHKSFGLANLVTTVRAALTCLLAGLLADGGHVSVAPQAAFAWGLAGLAAVAIALDGLDGFLARRLGLCSAFGARYDMEIDALLILLLSLAAYSLHKAGAWVILGGGFRYGFLAATWLWPALAGGLPPSSRRKLVCLIQMGVLCLVLTPIAQPPASAWLAAGALALLVYSFLVDVVWLLTGRGRSPTASR